MIQWWWWCCVILFSHDCSRKSKMKKNCVALHLLNSLLIRESFWPCRLRFSPTKSCVAVYVLRSLKSNVALLSPNRWTLNLTSLISCAMLPNLQVTTNYIKRRVTDFIPRNSIHCHPRVVVAGVKVLVDRNSSVLILLNHVTSCSQLLMVTIDFNRSLGLLSRSCWPIPSNYSRDWIRPSHCQPSQTLLVL